MPMRWLIVNADDFGLSPGVNRGILHAHSHGIVTSTSLMVRRAAAAEAAAEASNHPGLGLGLHLDLGEWERRDGDWRHTHRVVDTESGPAVATEVERQLERFRALTGQDPTHLDSHQHVHRDEPACSVIAAAAGALGVPLRDTGATRYCGAFYGQASGGEPLPDGISVEALVEIIQTLPEGYTELCCHPSDDPGLESPYASERPLELRSLCDPSVRRAVDDLGVRLCSFRELRA
jgi:chitin disaccharide deacetylase